MHLACISIWDAYRYGWEFGREILTFQKVLSVPLSFLLLLSSIPCIIKD